MHLIGHIIGGATGVGYFLERAFARFFNKLTKIITINNSDYLLDSIGESTRVAEPTQVVDSTYSAEVWIDADSAIGDLDSMTIDSESGEAAVSYVYQTGQTINTVSGRDGYRITLLTTQKQGNLKLKDLSGEIIAQYLLDEKEGIITFNRLVNNTYAINHGELVSATLPDARITSIEIEGVQNDLGYSVADGTELSGTVTVGARIPINPNSRTKDIFDNSATYTGKAGQHLKLVDRPCLLGDGVAKLTIANADTYDVGVVDIAGEGEKIVDINSGEYLLESGKSYKSLKLGLLMSQEYVDYKARVLAGGGTIQSPKTTDIIYKMLDDNNLSANTLLLITPTSGLNVRTSGVNKYITKAYDLSDNDNDATQTTEANQPHLSGIIAPNELERLKNGNGSFNCMTYPDINFSSTPFFWLIILLYHKKYIKSDYRTYTTKSLI